MRLSEWNPRPQAADLAGAPDLVEPSTLLEPPTFRSGGNDLPPASLAVADREVLIADHVLPRYQRLTCAPIAGWHAAKVLNEHARRSSPVFINVRHLARPIT